MNIVDILEIAAGVMLAKLIIGILNESYWYKWDRVRLEFNKLFCCCKRQKKEIKVSHQSKEYTETDFPFLQNLRRGQTTRKH